MTDQPLQPGEYVRFRGFGSPTFAAEDRPARVVAFDDPPSGNVTARLLDGRGMVSVPADRLTRAEPQTAGDLIEDEDGAPLPHELQRGGQAWMAVLEALYEAEQPAAPRPSRREVADGVMIRLAPVLWPLLPSNPDSAAGLDADAQAEREADAAEGDDTPDEIAARTEAPADAPMPTDLSDHPDTER